MPKLSAPAIAARLAALALPWVASARESGRAAYRLTQARAEEARSSRAIMLSLRKPAELAAACTLHETNQAIVRATDADRARLHNRACREHGDANRTTRSIRWS